MSTEPSWLVKDFNALYRAARQALDEARATGEISAALVGLAVHVERLKPAFDVTEAERLAAQPSWMRKAREEGKLG